MKFIVAVIMLFGLVSTVIPRIPGTIIILLGGFLYGISTSFEGFSTEFVLILLLLTIIAEAGGRGLRVWLTRRYHLTRIFSSNASAGNIAGVVATDAILGPILGVLLWELVAGKTFIPRWSTVAKVIGRLAIAAAFRFICGLIMIALIVGYLY